MENSQQRVARDLRQRARRTRWQSRAMLGLVVVLLVSAGAIFFAAGNIAESDFRRDSAPVASTAIKERMAILKEQIRQRAKQMQSIVSPPVPHKHNELSEMAQVLNADISDMINRSQKELEAWYFENYRRPVTPDEIIFSLILDKELAEQYGIQHERTYTYISERSFDAGIKISDGPEGLMDFGVLPSVLSCYETQAGPTLAFSGMPELRPDKAEKALSKYKDRIMETATKYYHVLDEMTAVAKEVCAKQSELIQENKNKLKELLSDQARDMQDITELDEGLRLVSENELKLRFGLVSADARDQALPSPNDLYQLIQTNITRFGSILVIFFFVHLLFSVYKYDVRLAGHYDARADAIEIFAETEDAIRLELLTKTLSPDSFDFGASPKAPTEVVADAFAGIANKTGGKKEV